MRGSPELRRLVVRWWGGGAGLTGRFLNGALWPAEQCFRAAVAARNAAYDRNWLPSQRGSIPIISVGNLSVGGEGKTPLTAWIARELERSGRRPAVIMRGYAADEVRVHRELNPGVPVYTSKRRAGAVVRAASDGRDVAVLDDAFQHRALRRDLDVVVLSAERWSLNPRLLPRGPWRESFSALRRAQMVVVTRKWSSVDRSAALGTLVREYAPHARVANCRLEISGLSELQGTRAPSGAVDWLQGRAVLAVASIGDPLSFARQLEGFGCDVELLAYPDHHRFTSGDVESLMRRAQNRTIAVTRKDAVKLRHLVDTTARIAVVEQEVRFESGEEEMKTMLRSAALR
jgi:tetraacyldisaccharide 4'-kinase